MSLSTSKPGIVCSTCGRINDKREFACKNCGSPFPVYSSTPRLADTKSSDPAFETPIRFEIEGTELIVSLCAQLTVGRRTTVDEQTQPDVDLSAYGARISRKHVRIRRENILIYVSDMGSTNGTLLNGHRLFPEAERLLRSGDELQLGSLKIRVRF